MCDPHSLGRAGGGRRRFAHSPKDLLRSLRCQAQSSMATCDIFLMSHSLTQLQHTKKCSGHFSSPPHSYFVSRWWKCDLPILVTSRCNLVGLVKQNCSNRWSVLVSNRRKREFTGKMYVHLLQVSFLLVLVNSLPSKNFTNSTTFDNSTLIKTLRKFLNAKTLQTKYFLKHGEINLVKSHHF